MEKNLWCLKWYLETDDELKRAYESKEPYCLWFQGSKKRGPEKILKTKEAVLEFYGLVE